MIHKDMTIRQKMIYIKRYSDIIDEDTARSIYNIVRKGSGEAPIRNSENDEGIYVDLAMLSDDQLDMIHRLTIRRVDFIVLK